MQKQGKNLFVLDGFHFGLKYEFYKRRPRVLYYSLERKDICVFHHM